MSKYDHLFFKKVKARTDHQCHLCMRTILTGEFYYREEIADKFLHSLHAKKFCSGCHGRG